MTRDPELIAKCLALARTVNGVDVRNLGVGGVAIVPPAPECSEREFQAAFDRAARELGWVTYHTHDSRRSPEGFPDSIAAREFGTLRMFVAELKVPPNKPTNAQRKWLRLFETAGVPAYLWYPHDWPAILETLRSE